MSFKLRKNNGENVKGFVIESHEFSIYIDEVDFCPSGRVGLMSNGKLIGFAGELIAEEFRSLNNIHQKTD